MRHRYHYILYLLLGICLMSCGNNEPIDSPDTDAEMLLMLTRAGTTPDATYGVMVYNGVNIYRYGNYTVDASNELIPYSIVNDEVQLDYRKGVYVPRGTYNMVLTSPALEIPERDIPSKKWTFEYKRNLDADNTPLYVSKAFSVNIYNRGELLGNTYYTCIDLGVNQHDIHLQERRSLINLIIECGEKIDKTEIKEVRIDNLIQSAEYNPDTDCFEDGALAQDKIERIDLLSDDNVVLSHTGTDSISLPDSSSSEKTVENKGHYIYVLSQDYSETISYGVFRHVTPRIFIKFKDDAESVIPLNVNFEPHKRYTCRVTVQSSYTGVTLTVEPWDSETSVGGINTPLSGINTSVSDDDIILTIGIGNFDITPWDPGSVSSDSQPTTIDTTIGGTTN